MYAIVDIAGQQFKVEKDQKLYVHRLAGETGAEVSFDKVLLIEKDSKITVGSPVISGAAVSAKVLDHVKGDKVLVFKKKRRKGYQKLNGHRQYFTQIQVTDIVEKGAKAAAAAKPAEKKEAATTATKAEEKKPAAKAPSAEKKTEAPKKATAEKKPVAEKAAAAKKPAAKPAAAKKTTTSASKSAEKKPAAKSAASKSTEAKKPAAKKPAAKKSNENKSDAKE